MAQSARDLGGWFRATAERCAYLVVRARSGRDGFALFGGHRPRHHFSRIYLGTTDHRLSLALHRDAVTCSCRKLLPEYGLVVFCEASVPPELANEVLHIPGMVELAMPVPAVLDGSHSHWSRSVKSDLARVRKRFQYEVQNGNDWVSEFRRRFHDPSMAQRYGVEAYTASVNDLGRSAQAPGAEFLRITRDGIWVGGVLNRSTTEGYRLHRLGWRDGDERLLKDGVVAAMYWSSIRRAAELGHSRIHFGSASPYLEDGLLFFKGKWGAQFEPLSHKYGGFGLLVNPSHATCRRFLAAHSLVAHGSNGDVIVFSGRRPGDVNVPPTVLSGVRRWYRWLAQPDPFGTITQAEVPASLRAWLVEEAITTTPAPAPSLPGTTSRS